MAQALGAGMAGHWPLTEDCRDHSGNGNDSHNHGVVFDAEGGAFFDGRGACIEAPNSAALCLGTGDFSVAAWVCTGKHLEDLLGDIAGKFDPGLRKGFNLCLQHFYGVASSQANHRNLLFGIDDGRHDAAWVDCGRPGNNLMVWALCVFDGHLYAGTFESASDQAGHIYRYAGGTEWVDCGSPYPSNAITALAVHEGALYAAASHYRSSGSALQDSENSFPGGVIFRYEGGATWTNCGKLGQSESVGGMAVFNGRLYASSMYAPAGLFRYEGGSAWAHCGHPGGRVEALTPHNGALYGSGWDLEHSGVYRYDEASDVGSRKPGRPPATGAWTDCGTPPGTTQTYSFAMYQGKLFVGTWPGGKVYRYGGGREWLDCGQLGGEQEVMGMMVYNGTLYAGTLPLAAVYRYKGEAAWACTGQLDTTPDVKYRRAWSMAVYQGALFCGTLPSGHVYRFEAGKSVTYDTALEAGWQHIAAVKRGGLLSLHVNGICVARSTAFDADGFDLANDHPLTIGSGQHGPFNGRIKDFRLYKRALEEHEIAALGRRTNASTTGE